MPALLITNPTAGRRRPEAAPDRLLAALSDCGIEAEAYCTSRRGDAEDAARAAARDGCDLIVVAGGDGTLNEVANGLTGCSIPVCLVPCGTENVVAKELKLPLEVPAACALAASGAARPVDSGLCNGRTFLLAAGVGFDAAIVRGVSLGLKRHLGEGAYWISGLWQILRARPAGYTLTIDGRELTGRFYGIVVTNTSSYAGRARVFPGARIDDGLLDVHLLHARGYARFLRTVLRLLRGRPVPEGEVESIAAASVECRSERPQPVHLDGDDHCDTPLSISVRPAALRVLVPGQER